MVNLSPAAASQEANRPEAAPLIKRDYRIGPGFLDAMEVLAQQAVLTCDKPLKEAYRCLITH